MQKIQNHPLPYTLFIHLEQPRPDYRVVANFLFASHHHQYDSDGNSYPASSRQWTELYLSSRVWRHYRVSLYAIQSEPLILKIQSSRKTIAYGIAYFLAQETQGQVYTLQEQYLPLQHLHKKLKNFALDRRLTIAKQSIWRQSSLENPYPNLKKDLLQNHHFDAKVLM